MLHKDDLFDADHNNTCQLYRDVRDGKNPGCMKVRANCYDLWSDYRKFADRNFIEDFAINFHHRWFEMYLTVFFVRSNIPIKCPKPGPDILLEIDGRCIWIEAVCPTSGQPNRADSVPEPPNRKSRRVPFDQYAMRIRNSLESKQAKFKDYLSKKIVDPKDLTVIAISAAEIPLLDFHLWEAMIRSLYGVGNKFFSVDSMTGKFAGSGRMYNPEIKKHSGAKLGVLPFMDNSMEHISAVIGSSASATVESQKIGKDCVLYRNLTSNNPWPKGYLPMLDEYLIDSTDGGYLFHEP